MTNSDNSSSSEPRWFALIDDTVYFVPRQHVEVSLLRDFASLDDGVQLIRDHKGSNDYSPAEDGVLDLADGNVFVSRARCSESNPDQPKTPAKLALCLDDRFELIPKNNISMRTFYALFGLNRDVEVLRDYESPDDKVLSSDDSVSYDDGPCFITRKCQPQAYEIIVNARPRSVSSSSISYEELVALAFPDATDQTCFAVSYLKGPQENPEGTLATDQTVTLKNGMIFNVDRADKS